MFPKAKPRVFDLKSVGFFRKVFGWNIPRHWPCFNLGELPFCRSLRGELVGSEESHPNKFSRRKHPSDVGRNVRFLGFFLGGEGSDRKDVVLFMVSTCYNLIVVLNFQVLPYRKWLYLGGQPPSVNHQDDMKNPVWMPPVGSRGTGVFL